MGKYICPYCGETENFIIKTESEEGATFDTDVRCNSCYSTLTNTACLNTESNKTHSVQHEKDKRRRYLRNAHSIPKELIEARRALNNDDTNKATMLFAECAKKYPFNWESVFYDALCIAKNNQSIQNITYYKVFAAKMHFALRLAAAELRDLELINAIKEITSVSLYMCSVFERNYIEVANDYLNGKYPEAQRLLISMDTSLIYDLLADFLCTDVYFYSDILLSLDPVVVGGMGLAKNKFLPHIINYPSSPSFSHPIEYFRCVTNNKTYSEVIALNETKPTWMK